MHFICFTIQNAANLARFLGHCKSTLKKEDFNLCPMASYFFAKFWQGLVCLYFKLMFVVFKALKSAGRNCPANSAKYFVLVCFFGKRLKF